MNVAQFKAQVDADITSKTANNSISPINVGENIKAAVDTSIDRSNHIGTQDWSTITNTPTTLAGYGITDAVSGNGASNRLAYWATATSIGYLNTASYPSLTEISRVKGVTSSIQDQLDNKQPLDSDLTTIAGLTPSDNDIIQRKSGAWVNRTMAQLAADLDLSGSYFAQGGNLLGTTGILGTIGANHLDFITNNTTRMRIASNGNGMFGTTTDAGYKFDVNGTLRNTGNFRSDNASNSNYFQVVTNVSNPYLQLFHSGAVDLRIGNQSNYLVFGQSNLTTYWPIRALSAKFDSGVIDLNSVTGAGNSTISMVASNNAGNQSSIRMANAGQDKWTFGVVQGQNRLMFKYNTSSLTSGSTEYFALLSTGGIRLNGTTDILTGSGSPEGVQAANVGSLYLRTDGGAGTTLYVKESGTGNTGWISK